MILQKLNSAVLLLFLVGISCANKSSTASSPIKGSGPIVEKTYEFDQNFTKLTTSQAWDVRLIKADKPKVVVRTHENLQEYVNPKVKNGKLAVEFERSISIKNTKTQEMDVYYTDLKEIHTSSASAVSSQEVLEQKELLLKSSSASSIELQLKVGKTTVEASSAATVKLSGTSIEFDGNASSAASIKAKDLKVKNAHAHASSAGSIQIQPIDFLDAGASSGGSVYYYGNPKSSEIEKNIAGSVHQKQL